VLEAELVPEVKHLGLVDGPLQLALGEDPGQIEEGAGDGGDGDALVDGDLVGGQARLMHADARAGAACLRNRHLARTAVADELPVRSARTVAQDCSGPIRQYSGHPPSLPSQPSLSDRVDPAVERVEALALQAMIDCPGAQTEGGQLRSSNHPVLTLSQARDHLVVTSLTFAPYYVVKVRLVAHAGQRASPGVTGGLRGLLVAFPDELQAVQGKEVVYLVDLVAEGHDGGRVPARGDRGRLFAKLLA
jgi:hypothetical protein